MGWLHFLFWLVAIPGHFVFSRRIANADPAQALQSTFTIVCPPLFRPNTNYSFLVSTSSGDFPTPFKFALMNTRTSTRLFSDVINLQPQQTKNVSISIPLLSKDNFPDATETWSLAAFKVLLSTREIEVAKTTKIRLDVSNSLALANEHRIPRVILIQTDKPVYKPEDALKLRVIVLDDSAGTGGNSRLPVGGTPVNVTIKDSKLNVVGRWTQNTTVNGLVSIIFDLSLDPNFGNWTVTAQSGKARADVYVEVKEYILPKFKVQVILPSQLVTASSSKVTAEIRATYTYGKALQGSYTLTINSTPVSSSFKTVVKSGTLPRDMGVVFVSLDVAPNRIYTVVANVSEASTNRFESGRAILRVDAKETFEIHWVNRPDKFKPGIPLTVKLQVTGKNGRLVSDSNPAALTLTPHTSSKLSSIKSAIAADGFASFTLNTELLPSFTSTYKEKTATFLVPEPITSASGILLEVSPTVDAQPILQSHGTYYSFTVTANRQVLRTVNYILYDGQDIVHADAVTLSPETSVKEGTFQVFVLTREYAGLQLLVYFKDMELVAASTTILARNYLDIQFATRKEEIVILPPTTTMANSTTLFSTNIETPATLNASIAIMSPETPATLNASIAIMSPETPTTNTTLEAPAEENGLEDYDSLDAAAPRFRRRRSVTANSELTERRWKIRPIDDNEKLKMEPGTNISLILKTYPKSTVAIRGVDQSVLLLSSTDNDITQDVLDAQARKSMAASKENISYVQEFNRIGLVVFSSDILDSGVRSLGGNENTRERNVQRAEPQPAVAPTLPESIRTRTEFPETWIWDEIPVTNGTTTVWNTTVPDTMTSWIITGFSLNSHQGLGINSAGHNRPLTVFRPFFVTLHLPYSVIMTEQLAIHVLVHNYMGRDIIAQVTLSNKNNDYVFLDSREQDLPEVTHPVAVRANSVATAYFAIMPLKFGNIPLDVRAVTAGAGDAIRQPLRVKPPGDFDFVNQVLVLDLQSPTLRTPATEMTDVTAAHNFSTKYPEDRKLRRVAGADRIKLTVIGDHVAMMVANLDHLVALPTGCGEQNMLRFVPNVLALDYLFAIDNLKEEVKIKALKFLSEGYQNQMTHRRTDDGSFAIYKHHQGSTWLTAYVIWSFAQAKKWTLIDSTVISSGVSFIMKNQNADGEFVERGTVWYTTMQSRSAEKGVALTAYTTLALIQLSMYGPEVYLTMAIHRGLQYISTAASFANKDPYLTNLVTAALVAGKHNEAGKWLAKMEANVVVKGEWKFWTPVDQSPGSKSKPLSVEMTSYALLALLWNQSNNNLTNAAALAPISKWLLNQRNSKGGFVSTQDTVMGLTALTKFAMQTKAKPGDVLTLKVTTEAGTRTVEVSERNRMVLQEFRIPPASKWVHIDSLGQGQALVQLTTSWYAQPKRLTRTASSHFLVDAKLVEDEEYEGVYNMSLCVSWSFTSDSPRDVISEVLLPSGFYFIPQDLAQSPPPTSEFEKYDVKERSTKIFLYYKYKSRESRTCIDLPANRVEDIASLQNPTVRVYEYGDNSISSTHRYRSPKNVNICYICSTTHACDRTDCEPGTAGR